MPHAPRPEELKPSQREVIKLMASGQTASAAAKAAGVHRSTINHWERTNPAFRSLLETAKAEYTHEWRDEIRQLARAAVETVAGVLEDPKASATARLKAAQMVLQVVQQPDPAVGEGLGAGSLAVVFAPEECGAEEPAAEDVVGLSGVGGDEESVPASRAEGEEQWRRLSSTPPREYREPEGPGPYDLCPCGTGAKYKYCCGVHLFLQGPRAA